MLYKHGLPFSESIARDLDPLIERIDNNKATLIVIDGLMGEGKTTLAVEFAEYITKKKNGVIGKEQFYYKRDIDIKKQLSTGGDDFQNKLKICADEKLYTLIYDEAGDFSRRGAITSFNQRLNRVFQTFRTFRVFLILCLPCVDTLDQEIFKAGVPRALFNCHNRTKNQGDIRVYGLEEMFWLRHYMSKEVVSPKAYKKVAPNSRGHFKNLPDDYSIELDGISTIAKMDTLEKSRVKVSGLLSIRDIAEKTGKTLQAIKQKISVYKIESTATVGRTKFYSPDLLDFFLSDGRSK